MKAVLLTEFGSIEGFQLVERAVPEPAAGEVRIRVHAIGVNPVDIWMRRGNGGGALPLLLGRDVSGVIDAVGDGVRGFTVCDAVYARASAARLAFGAPATWNVYGEQLAALARLLMTA